jgi:uncharacterized protein YjdB
LLFRGRVRGLRAALSALVVWVGTSAAIAAGAEAPALLCAPAKADGAAAALELAVTDRFASRELTLAKASAVCWAELPGDAMFAGYAARTRPRKARRVGAAVEVVTRFGRQALAVKAIAGVLVPSSDDGGAPASAPRSCYAVRGDRPGTKRLRVAVTDASGERFFDVGRPTRLCVPTGDDALEVVCHAVKLARTKPLRQPVVRAGSMTLSNQFGTHEVRVGAPDELCVAVLTSDPKPSPGYRLEITPRELTIFRPTEVNAIAHYDDGRTENVSKRIGWSAVDAGIVDFSDPLDGSGGIAGNWVLPIAPGTTTIYVSDLDGVSSTDTGGDATVTVTWPLERIELTPPAVTRVPGAGQNYSAWGIFPDGYRRNLTRQVVYATSNPSVATVSNVPPTRSRVTAVAPGVAMISATDPISGISSTDSGGDAVFTVKRTISYLVITSNLRHSSRFPGESQRFTATGYYSDGTTTNLTQKCEWKSSDPGVALAPNTLHDASRIDAVAPGITFIDCKDYETGKTSSQIPFWVLGDLTAIQAWEGLQPLEFPRIGGSVYLTAIGQYVGGGARNLTQEVMWATRDPELALCTNEPGRRSRVVSLDGGLARVYATDTASGIVSNDAVITMLGELVDLYVRAPYPYYKFDAIPVGSDVDFHVTGVFEHGSLNLSNVGAGYVLESSDPSVAEIVSERLVRAVAPGTFELTARDVETGFTSAPFIVKVVGGLESITLTPATATRGIDEWESFTAIGFYPPGIEELLTQRLVYSSSDPSVAVADNEPGMRSRVRTVGPGTATITATHVESGLTATATITVLPGAIERVTIEPPSVVRNLGNDFSFTAIGHYPDGSTINVTQIVSWVSLSPDVATATNEGGDRSRVVAVSPGGAFIVANHPSGVSSHDTGDDATFVSKRLVGLALTPASHLGPVGMTERYTLVGTFDDASTINLTQDAYYWVDDPAVARADNLEGDRSAVELLAPGSTTVHAAFADWTQGFPVLSEDTAETSLAVHP